MTSKTLTEIDSLMEDLEPESLRFHVLDAVKRFKGNWLELGRFVSAVEKQGVFRDWGFATFDSYCTRELKLKRPTVVKLLNSFRFLKKEEPEFLSTALSAGEKPPLPDYESVNILRQARAKKAITGEDYARLRSAVFEDEVPAKEVGQQYRGLLQTAREAALDPEEAYLRKRKEALKRVLGSLRTIRNTVELSHLLPAPGLEALKNLISRVEDELTG
ncbi:MAG: hypothetical protein P9M08_09615 [Candidatus Erginobacter occultus]|nr:hypothetical protein [Candidatus Erginobacter occultus]